MMELQTTTSFCIADTVCVHKPLFLPWLPLFARIACSDTYVALDDVQFRSGYYDNRTKVVQRRSGERSLQLLTMRVSGPRMRPLNEVRVFQGNNLLKAIRTIEQGYSRAEHFDECWGPLREVLEDIDERGGSVYEANVRTLLTLFELSGIEPPTIVPSSHIYQGRDRNARIAQDCQAVGKRFFLSGWGMGGTVHNLEYLSDEGITFVGLDEERVRGLIGDDALQPGLSTLHHLFVGGPAFVRDSVQAIREVYLDEISRV